MTSQKTATMSEPGSGDEMASIVFRRAAGDEVTPAAQVLGRS